MLKLSDIVTALEMNDSQSQSYLNVKSFEIVWISEYDDTSKEIDIEDECFLPIPTQYDVHEYRIMENFALSCVDTNKQNQMLSALRGKSAFRKFKDTIFYLDLRQQWFDYRKTAFEKIARDWCDNMSIKIEDDGDF